MKYFGLLFISMLWLIHPLKSGTMKIVNTTPKKGKDTVTLYYTASKTSLAKAKKLYVIVHNYTAREQKPYALQYVLESYPTAKSKDSLTFIARFVPKQDISLLLLKVTDAHRYNDNNDGLFWEILPKEEDGSIPIGQSLRLIASYSESLPEQCKRTTDINKALHILQHNTDSSLSAFQRAFFANMLPFMNKQFDRDSLRKKMMQFLDTFKPDTEYEPEIRILTQAMRIVGRADLADSIEKEYEYLHPLDEFSEDAASARVFSSKNKEEFLQQAERFLQLYPNSYAVMGISESYVRVMLKEGKLAQLTERFLRDPTLPTNPSLDLANTFLEKDSLKEALRWAERAVFYARDESSVLQPKYLAPCEFAEERKKVIAEGLLAPAFVHKKMNNYDLSLKLYKEIITDFPDKLGIMQMTSVYQSIIELLDALSNQQEAYAFATKAISSGYISDKIISDYEKLHDYLKKEDIVKSDYASDLQELLNLGKTAKQMLVLEDQLSIPPVITSLKRADGSTISPADWKGKVVFLDFWATWCGPCIRSFPGVQKLYDKYKNNPNVVFAIINVWERVEDRFASVRAFLDKNTYTFPIYYDLKDEMVKGYGVTGIPSKFILDKQGIGRFMEVGLEEEQTFIDETSMKIDALLVQ